MRGSPTSCPTSSTRTTPCPRYHLASASAAAVEDAAAGLHSHQIQTTTSSACHLLPSSCHGQPEAAAVMASALMQSLTNDHLLLGGSSNITMASSFGCFPLISCPSSMAPISPPSHSMLMVAADKNPSQQQQQDPSTITKKREERDRAKLRYNEKKKNRKDLASEGVFDVISDVLQSQDKELVSAGTDILVHFLNQDPNLPRSYIAHQEQNSQEGNSLLGLLVQGMVTNFGEEMHCQFPEILRILLDGSAANTVMQCREVVIEVFYEKHLDKLIDVIASSCPSKSIALSSSGSVGVGTRVEEHSAKPDILSNICEILCFCVVHHPYKIKLNFFTSNSMEKILTLTRRRERFLVVAAVRFMRTVISRNDELLIGHVIKFNLLKPIIGAFIENGDRYNMLHSGVLELLEYIRKENLKSLVVYVVESFWDQLVKFEQLGSIQAFKLKYQQFTESAEPKQSTSVVDMRKKAEERGLDKEEEDYFNKDSDEEDSARRTTCTRKQSKVKSANESEIHDIPARPKPGGLVDYDDDEDYNPPPKKPVKADEDDEALNIPMVKRSPVDGKHTDGKVPKKPKLEARISCAKIGASVNVGGRYSDLEDKPAPLSPASSTKNSEGNDDVGEGSPGSQNEQHATENLDSVHQAGDDCTEAGGNLSPEMVVNATKATDSESYSVR